MNLILKTRIELGNLVFWNSIFCDFNSVYEPQQSNKITSTIFRRFGSTKNVMLYVQRLIINAIHSRKINDARYTLEPLERDAPRRDQKPLRSSQRDVI